MLIAFVVGIWLGLPPVRSTFTQYAPWIAGCHAFAAYLGVRHVLKPRKESGSAESLTSLAVGGALLTVPLITGSGFETFFILFGFVPLSYMVALNITFTITKSRH